LGRRGATTTWHLGGIYVIMCWVTNVLYKREELISLGES